MTQDEIIRMAREAGITVYNNEIQSVECESNHLERFAALVREDEREPYIKIIEQLWNIIDDIDTYGDMAKGDEKLYRSLVERKQRERFKTGITTDGYTLDIAAAIRSMK